MIDTGTLAKAADLMIEKGFGVRACTHAILSGDAYEK
jgi:phosphoribosylpyrophosphate synthetase